MGSAKPANGVLGLSRHGVDCGNVETIATICPINFFVRFEPGVDVERLPFTDLKQSESVLNCWVARRMLQQGALDLARRFKVIQPYQNTCQNGGCHLIGRVRFQIFPQLVASTQKIALRTIGQAQFATNKFRVELLSSLESRDAFRSEAFRHVVKTSGIKGQCGITCSCEGCFYTFPSSINLRLLNLNQG